MSSRSVFIIQKIVVFITGGFLWPFIGMYFSSTWGHVLLFFIAWFIIGWLEIVLIGLLDPDVRLASKLCIRVENLSVYREAFNRLVEAEMRGEETGWIGDSLPDQGEWLRYLRYEIKKGWKDYYKGWEDYHEVDDEN